MEQADVPSTSSLTGLSQFSLPSYHSKAQLTRSPRYCQRGAERTFSI